MLSLIPYPIDHFHMLYGSWYALRRESQFMSETRIEEIIIKRIKEELGPAQVQLRDMTGARDHWEAIIISEHFDGLRLIARQQRVYKSLGELMTGPIHAFTMQTLTPGEAEQRGITVQPNAPELHASLHSDRSVKAQEGQPSKGLISLD